MDGTYLALDYGDLLLTASLLALHGALSVFLQLGLLQRVAVAAVRMVVQLTLVGFVLTTLFALTSLLWTAVAALAMILFAGREAMARQDRPLTGLWSYGIGTAAMLAASLIVTVFALTTPIAPDPWYDPRYALPLLGMILGNTMNGISLGMQTFTNGLVRERRAVEAQLCLGASRWQALLPVTRMALRTGLIPILNAMSATGLVFLPGLMTGQILAGVDPTQAVKYQILIMFLIAGGTALGTTAAVIGSFFRLTDRRHRLRLERMANQGQ